MPASTADRLETLNANLRATLPNGRIVAQPLPECGDITLGLIDPEFPTGPLPPDVMHAVIERPAYWAFCWGSGLGLARMLFQHPEWVRGKSIIDLGSGSGVVAIAAARCGATRVIACDNDPLALAATRANAALNDIRESAFDKYKLTCAHIHHSIGLVKTGEICLFVCSVKLF